MANSSIIGALQVQLGMDSAAFTKGARDAQGQIRRLGNNIADIGKRLSIVSGAMAGVGVAMLGLANSTAQAGREIGRQAQIANASAEEFQRWSAGAKDVGIEQDKLADILKDVNDRVGDFLNTGGGPMADFFEKIAPKVGVTADQFKNLSGPQALQLYVDTLEKAGVNQQEMTFYLEAMASDATALIPLLKNGGREMRRFGDAAAEAGGIMSNESVEASVEFQRRLESLKGALTGIRNSLGAELLPVMSEFLTQMKDVLIPVLRSGVGYLQSAVRWFNNLSDPVQRAVIAVAGLAAALGPVLLGIGATLILLAPLGGMVGGIVGALAAISAPAAATAAAFVAVGAGLVYAYKNVEPFRNAINGVLEFLRPVAEVLNDSLATGFRSIAALLRGDVLGAIEEIGGFVSRLGDRFLSMGESARDGVVQLARTLAAGLASIAEQALGWAQGIVSNIWQGLQGLYQMGIDAISELARGFRERVTGLAAEARQWGIDIVAGLQEGINSSVEGAVGAVTGVAERIGLGFRRTLGIESPSTVFAEYGQNIIEGLQIGLQGSEGLMEQVKGLAQGLGDNFQQNVNFSGALDTAKGFFGSMAQVLQQGGDRSFKISKKFAIADALISTYTGAAKALKLEFPKNLAAFGMVMAKGLATVSAIKGTNPGGGGGGNPGAGGGGAAGSIVTNVEREAPARVLIEGFSPDQLYTGTQVQGLVDAIQGEFKNRGLKLVFA